MHFGQRIILCLLLSTCLSLTSNAQTHFTDGALYYYSSYGDLGELEYQGVDTLKYLGTNGTTEFYSFFRDSIHVRNDSVFRINRNADTTVIEVLGDFNLNLGDTFRVSGEGSAAYTVDTVNTQKIGGMARKRMYLKALPSNPNGDFVIIKGVTELPLWPYHGFRSVSGIKNLDFICADGFAVKINNGPFYRSDVQELDRDSACNLYHRMLVVQSLESELKVFPNPTNGILHITPNFKYSSMSLYDLMGKQVLHIPSFLEDELTIDLSHLPKGVYRLVMINTSGYQIQHSLIRQ